MNELKELKHVDIYTDGGCSGNPGPGGYGTILVYNGREKVLSGGAKETTNNKMELLAVITGLRALKESCEVTVTTDSKYVVDAIEKGWLKSWKDHFWLKADRKPVLNQDLWAELDFLLAKHKVSFEWVKGHAGHPYNEKCDSLAQMEIAKLKYPEVMK